MAKPKISAPLVESIYVRVTAPGSGGIATFVLDGWGVVSKIQHALKMKHKLRLSERGDLHFARIVGRRGQVIDEAVISFLASDETGTGYEQLELSCHGGPGATAAVEEVLVEAGFQRAEGSELVARSHQNNRLAIVLAEAQLALAHAVTARQADFLLGAETFLREMGTHWIERRALGMRQQDPLWREQTLLAVREALARAPGSLALLRTHSVVLTGPVNAGKSTLANRLAGAERHLVSAEPGTTRDRVETRVALRGLDIALSDTAGLRESKDELEVEGQRRAEAAASDSTLRVLVVDGSAPIADEALDRIAKLKAYGPLLVALNKCDLGIDASAEGLSFIAGTEPIQVSARDGSGIDDLEQAIERTLLHNLAPEAGDPFHGAADRITQ